MKKFNSKKMMTKTSGLKRKIKPWFGDKIAQAKAQGKPMATRAPRPNR
jgi:hypothetical protein